jgi:hypothetical protein
MFDSILPYIGEDNRSVGVLFDLDQSAHSYSNAATCTVTPNQAVRSGIQR